MELGTHSLSAFIAALLPILLVLGIAFFLPQLFLTYSHKGYAQPYKIDTGFKLGLENISQDFLLALTQAHNISYSVALVTNQTGKDQVGNRNIDVLLAKGLPIKKVFVTFSSNGSANSFKTVDLVTRIPIVSLRDRRLKREDVKDVDVIFFDLQDIGIRYCSSLGILMNVMELAGIMDKTVVVLDRPNLFGDVVEGGFDCADIENSLLPASVPIRYGMTIGELAQYCNKYLLKKAAKLFVVPMDHYNRHLYRYKELAGNLSPNINSLQSCHGYSFLGLLGEVAPFDIGIGTNKAFQCILLPKHVNFSKKQWFTFKTKLDELGIDSTYYRYFSNRKKEFCAGLRLCIRDISNFSLFKALVTTLEFFKAQGVKLTFSEKFDTIPGMKRIKELIAGSLKREDLEAEIKYSLEHFFVMASSTFIYKPYPKIITC